MISPRSDQLSRLHEEISYSCNSLSMFLTSSGDWVSEYKLSLQCLTPNASWKHKRSQSDRSVGWGSWGRSLHPYQQQHSSVWGMILFPAGSWIFWGNPVGSFLHRMGVHTASSAALSAPTPPAFQQGSNSAGRDGHGVISPQLPKTVLVLVELCVDSFSPLQASQIW